MPELPEVETIRRALAEYCLNETLETVSVKTPALIKNASVDRFLNEFRHKQLVEIERRAKFLIFNFENRYMVCHLGMSGIFLKDASQSRFPQHIHLIWEFKSGKRLYYQDVRKFGKFWLYDTQPDFTNLGVEPFSEHFTFERLKALIQHKKTGIKLFLMDQSNIAGIGNIYASEILFRAGISPLKKCSDLSDREIRSLYSAIQEILQSAIKNFGTTYSAYRTVSGENGQNQNFLKVYQKAGLPCHQCATPIEKIILGNRSTFYCPRCQK